MATTRRTFHVRVSAKGNCLTIVEKPPRCGYTVQTVSELDAFVLIDAFRVGQQWATEAAERGEIQTLRS